MRVSRRAEAAPLRLTGEVRVWDGHVVAHAEPGQELETVDINVDAWTNLPVAGTVVRCARSLEMTVPEWREFAARVEAEIARDEARQVLRGLRGPEEKA